jgi:signal transduction histidine kinase
MTPDEAERRGAERRTEDSLLRRIIDHVADGIVIVNAEGTVRFVNPAAEALLGRSAEGMRDEPFSFPMVAGERAEIEIGSRADGPLIAELRVVEMEWDGAPARLISLRDITDRKKAEERRQQLVRAQTARERAEAEERKFRFLAEAGTVLDSSLDYREVLDRLARLVVEPRDELHAPTGDRPPHPRLADWCVVDVVEDTGEIARVAAFHFDPAKRPLMDELVELFPPDWYHPFPASRAIETREPVIYPELDDAALRELSRSDEHADLLSRIGINSLIAVPLLTRGEVAGALTLACAGHGYGEADLALASDIGQRAALAVANARLYRAAQQASRAKSDFLAVMSHELRTPLNGIMGYSELLEAGVNGELNDRQRESLGRIRESSRHLLEIVDEILTYTRMEAGRESVERTDVDLGELVRDVGALVEPLVTRKGLELQVDAPPEAIVVQTDPAKVRQILLNLLSNAVKFTEAGQIRLSVRRDGTGPVLEVCDTGVGIAVEHMHHVFEPFWQVEQAATRSVGGTGLGLSVAQRLAELLGGSLTLRSTPSEGSTFQLILPSGPPPAGRTPGDDTAPPGSGNPG